MVVAIRDTSVAPSSKMYPEYSTPSGMLYSTRLFRLARLLRSITRSFIALISRSRVTVRAGPSSSSSYFCAGQRLTPHNRTLEVRPGRITKKLELKYDYDCERDDTNSLLGVLMFGGDVVIANNE